MMRSGKLVIEAPTGEDVINVIARGWTWPEDWSLQSKQEAVGRLAERCLEALREGHVRLIIEEPSHGGTDAGVALHPEET